MKKMNVLLTTMAVTTLLGGSVTAFAEGEQTTGEANVKYDNTNAIVDPTNPNDPDYLIRIPAAVNFTDENRSVDTTISMVKPDGTTYDGEKAADVSVSSANGFKLKDSGEKDAIAYSLFYKDTATNENKEISVPDDVEKKVIGTLNKGTASITGKAVLSQDKAQLQALYSDTLTFTVAKAAEEIITPSVD